MQFTALAAMTLLGSAFAVPAQNHVARSGSTSTVSVIPTPSSSGPMVYSAPAVQSAESQYLADYSSYLSATGAAQSSLYSKLTPDLQAIQSAEAAAWSSSIPSATPAAQRH
ncbi:uncharacterized protein N7498_010848 [Penicillium cinerascens]|uniref:Uncharacterized protein n=1 Tax=Penicillium cinerascens TaxID=70096 RepID=A0A9W9J793_9EURO|nr:uncharacterized protein N7498_010848 [Penicillium cinerascens]KAJ5191863.1 hypothetical protein N7498_010848 [Penicillium cinerascens]